MKTKELNAILASHKEWLERGVGGRANLTEADLTGANLTGANLTEAYLRGANLTGANLRGANLLHPPVNDPRGYRCVAVWRNDQWMIAAGCRWLNVPEAIIHWGPDYAGDRAIGDAYLSAVEWVAVQPGPDSDRRREA